jgi:hypothetical protein
MSDTKFTPGPWHLMPRREDRPPVVQRGHEGGFVVSGVTASREDADARLIASAPELFEALHRLEVAANTIAYCYRNRPENFAMALQSLEQDAEHARSIVSKATGASHD